MVSKQPVLDPEDGVTPYYGIWPVFVEYKMSRIRNTGVVSRKFTSKEPYLESQMMMADGSSEVLVGLKVTRYFSHGENSMNWKTKKKDINALIR